jgi:hypothetical protein
MQDAFLRNYIPSISPGQFMKHTTSIFNSPNTSYSLLPLIPFAFFIFFIVSPHLAEHGTVSLDQVPYDHSADVNLGSMQLEHHVRLSAGIAPQWHPWEIVFRTKVTSNLMLH